VISKPPSFLVIVIKRWQTESLEKDTRRVPILEKINFVVDPLSQQSKPYDLVSTVQHIGETPVSGHYNCCIKSTNGDWIEIDDAKKKCVAVKHQCAEVYVLMYVKEELSTSPSTSQSTSCSVVDANVVSEPVVTDGADQVMQNTVVGEPVVSDGAGQVMENSIVGSQPVVTGGGSQPVVDANVVSEPVVTDGADQVMQNTVVGEPVVSDGAGQVMKNNIVGSQPVVTGGGTNVQKNPNLASEFVTESQGINTLADIKMKSSYLSTVVQNELPQIEIAINRISCDTLQKLGPGQRTKEEEEEALDRLRKWLCTLQKEVDEIFPIKERTGRDKRCGCSSCKQLCSTADSHDQVKNGRSLNGAIDTISVVLAEHFISLENKPMTIHDIGHELSISLFIAIVNAIEFLIEIGKISSVASFNRNVIIQVACYEVCEPLSAVYKLVVQKIREEASRCGLPIFDHVIIVNAAFPYISIATAKKIVKSLDSESTSERNEQYIKEELDVSKDPKEILNSMEILLTDVNVCILNCSAWSISIIETILHYWKLCGKRESIVIQFPDAKDRRKTVQSKDDKYENIPERPEILVHTCVTQSQGNIADWVPQNNIDVFQIHQLVDKKSTTEDNKNNQILRDNCTDAIQLILKEIFKDPKTTFYLEWVALPAQKCKALIGEFKNTIQGQKSTMNFHESETDAGKTFLLAVFYGDKLIPGSFMSFSIVSKIVE